MRPGQNYSIDFKPLAIEDLDAIPVRDALRVQAKIARLGNGLVGDVKRLSSFTPSYRLRVGDNRVLFEVEGDRVVIYRVRNRRDAYH